MRGNDILSSKWIKQGTHLFLHAACLKYYRWEEMQCNAVSIRARDFMYSSLF